MKLQALSLKTKISLLLVSLFVAGVWLVVVLLAQRLERDVTALLSDQQFSVAAYVADEIDSNLANRVSLLEANAARVTPAQLADPRGLERFLEERVSLQNMFKDGLAFIARSGKGIADYPHLEARHLGSYVDADYFQAVLTTGRAAIGKARLDPHSGRPGIVIAAPIRDGRGGVIAVLAGFASLSDPTLFGPVERMTLGRTGYVAIDDPRHQLIVTSSDPARILDRMAAPGVNAMLDRFVAGYEGSGVAINSRGIETLTSAKRIATAGWIAQVVMPTREAFAPVWAMVRSAYEIAVAISLVMVLLTWLLIRRSFRRLDQATASIQAMTDGRAGIVTLPVVGVGDEVGRLVAAFNQLLAQRHAVELSLRESSERLQAVLLAIAESIFLLDREGRVILANPTGAARLGKAPAELVGQDVFALLPAEVAARRRGRFQDVFRTGQPLGYEDMRSGRHYASIHYPVLDASHHCTAVVLFAQDITERKQAEEQMQLASLVYRTTAEAMMVTDADGVILDVNPAFTRMTGFDAPEAIGQTPRILRSGRHDEAFYQAMWDKLIATGAWEGEIWDRRKNGEIYPKYVTINTAPASEGVPLRRIALFTDITEKKKSEEMIWRQANYDGLTGLPNRRMFMDRLTQEMRKAHRTGLPVALMFLDLDRFKEINDTLGHDMGDLLLKEAARRLSSCVRESDTVARLGGDEFTIVAGDLEDIGNAEHIAQEILRRLAKPFHLRNEVIYVTGSIGLTFFPGDAEEVEDLLKHADQAMYAAKNQGRNRYSYFTPHMQEAAQRRLRLANDLRGALAGNEFRVHYQPIVELATGRIHKAEALIRWQHPSRGLVSPAEFIPIAEDTGMIIDIGDWVFREAVRQVQKWRVDYCGDFQVSVNKSPIQFRNEGSSHGPWVDYLQQMGVPGQCVAVEITEGLLMEAGGVVRNHLLGFRDAGMQVSLDDFGTGYSSLAYLKKFDIDYLKIDQSFVRNLTAEYAAGEIEAGAVAACALGRIHGLVGRMHQGFRVGHGRL